MSTTTRPRSPLVGVPAAVGAERRRWPGSAAARLPLLGLVAAGLQGLLYLAGSTRHGWAALTAWQILWVSFLGPVGIGLLAGLLGRRETTARGGGAWWRPVTGRRAHLAGFVVLAGYALVMQLAVLLAAVPFGWVGDLSFPGPVGHLLLVAAALWVSTLALLAVAHQVALRAGLLAATGFGLVWALAGTFTAETSGWWWQPWAWTVRAMLPLTGTHANGVPLEPGSPLVGASIWPALLATALLAAGVTAIGSRPWRRARLLRRSAAGHAAHATAARPVRLPRRWRVTGPVAALVVGLRGTSIAPLLLVAAGTVPLGLWLWADPTTTTQLVALLLMPVGTTLLPVLTWQAVAPAWRALGARPLPPAALSARLALVNAGAVVVFGAWCGLLLGAAGLGWSDAAELTALLAVTGTALTWWHLWLAVRWHIAVALAAGAVGTLLALVVGGTGLATQLWIVVPWAWAETGTASPARLVVCLGLSVGASALLFLACRPAGIRAAAATAP
ncbi:hypothetical protein SAMN04488544_2479 [Microlunatus sagamiharensis]|uniref:ABC-2 type transport system permease protein n=1 Tax=Microlunatus sagamiharensis TaxID=546874 RepID=A0A1H2MQC0_9ACTN|nr:hypothetical protein SAMN04488544_2479 [Microlunatus sagamiharensis]